jgi:predicted metalloprotease with PDZ domain
VAAYRAGLRTGDEVARVNGRAVDGPDDWRAATAGLRVGDTLAVDATRDGRPVRAAVALPAYRVLRVRLLDVPAPSPAQRATRAAWAAGAGAGAADGEPASGEPTGAP